MFKITLEDFLEEIKAELFSYEDLSEEDILLWEEKFKSLFNNNKFKSMKILGNKIVLEDETEIFQIADAFVIAMIDDELSKYWDSL